jgi:hypothetical protein
MIGIVTETTTTHSQTVHKFENGYGVSIVKLNSSGNKSYEIAILQYKSDESYELVYPEFTNGDIIQCGNYDEIKLIISLVEKL